MWQVMLMTLYINWYAWAWPQRGVTINILIVEESNLKMLFSLRRALLEPASQSVLIWFCTITYGSVLEYVVVKSKIIKKKWNIGDKDWSLMSDDSATAEIYRWHIFNIHNVTLNISISTKLYSCVKI